MASGDKVFMPLLGKPLLASTIAPFQNVPEIQAITLVVAENNLARANALVETYGFEKVLTVCAGGARRQDSVWNGMQTVKDYRWLVVHDGARPCVTIDEIQRGLQEAAQWGTAVAAVPVKDTIKISGGDRMILETLDRSTLWSAQTPQIFPRNLLYDAYQYNTAEVTDDASLVESTGHPVHLYFGSYENIKVTTPDDMLLAELFLKQREGISHEGWDRI